MKYSNLPESEKEKIRDQRRGWNVDGDWWDNIFAEVVQVLQLMGFDTTVEQIFFSGFASQGDGASFQGYWSAPLGPPSATLRVYAPEDEKLHRIADAFTAFLMRYRLAGREVTFRITTVGRYSHSRTMRVASLEVYDDVTFSELLRNEDEDDFLKMARDLADWVYDQLEKEYEHLTSDETLDEQFADEEIEA